MTRISIATLAAALVLLSSCNKDRYQDNSSDTATDIFIENDTELRYIKLGGNTIPTMTRAHVDSFDDMNDHMGLFCLAARKTDVSGADQAKSINWNDVVSTDPELYGATTNGIYWGNACCNVTREDGIYRIAPIIEETCYRYYPMTSWFGYDFYGYYPYQGDYQRSVDSVYINMAIDGTQDVIWGRSETPDFGALTSITSLQDKLSRCYYSACYFRNHPQKVEDVHMKFEHKLTQFRFFVYPGASKEGAVEKKYDEATSLCVKELRLNDVAGNIRLVIADRSESNRSGTLSSIEGHSTTDFYLHHEDGTILADNPVNVVTKEINGVTVPDTTQLGDCIMVLPGKTVYNMSVVLADKENHEVIYPSERNITIALNAEQTKYFEPGKIYNVYLRVAGVTMIGITAELDDWEESEEEIDFIEFN